MKNKTAPSRNIKAPFFKGICTCYRKSQLTYRVIFLIYLDVFLIFHNIFPKHEGEIRIKADFSFIFYAGI